MELVLNQSDFVNDKYSVIYDDGKKEALFTIVDEHFAGKLSVGRVNRVVCMVRGIKTDGTADPAVIVSSIIGDIGTIGMGDNTIGIHTTNRELLGKVLNKDNMGECTIELYEY